MAFYYDSPGSVQSVDWYFADADSGQMPFATLFYSRIYDRKDAVQDTLGERYSPVPYRKGEKPYPLTSGGLCGTQEEWQRGSSILAPLPPLYPGSNWPMCCSTPPQESADIAIGFEALDVNPDLVCQVFGLGPLMPPAMYGSIDFPPGTMISNPVFIGDPLGETWNFSVGTVGVTDYWYCSLQCYLGQLVASLLYCQPPVGLTGDFSTQFGAPQGWPESFDLATRTIVYYFDWSPDPWTYPVPPSPPFRLTLTWP